MPKARSINLGKAKGFHFAHFSVGCELFHTYVPALSAQ